MSVGCGRQVQASTTITTITVVVVVMIMKLILVRRRVITEFGHQSTRTLKVLGGFVPVMWEGLLVSMLEA